MNISAAFDNLHARARQNLWLWLFSVFCRFSLALGFIPAGIVKLQDERFASGLHTNHPMGHYLEALHTTGFYYTFIGVVQIVAAIMLLIPRTVTLGAFLYFPVIFNIMILTYATRFDGSLLTAPLMTLANLYLLGWNYEKWKYILPFNILPNAATIENNFKKDAAAPEKISWNVVFSERGAQLLRARFFNFFKALLSEKFPTLFFAGVFAAVVICVIAIPSFYTVKPRNTLPQCLRQFKNTNRTQAGEKFCACVHQRGEPLNNCLNEFFDAADDFPKAP